MDSRHAVSLFSVGLGFIGGYVGASTGQSVYWAGHTVAAIGFMGVVESLQKLSGQYQEGRSLSWRTILELAGNVSLSYGGMFLARLDTPDYTYWSLQSICQSPESTCQSAELVYQEALLAFHQE